MRNGFTDALRRDEPSKTTSAEAMRDKDDSPGL